MPFSEHVWARRVSSGSGESAPYFSTRPDDCVDALLLAAREEKANGQIFNLGGSGFISLKDLASLLIEVYGQGECVIREFPPDRKRIDIGDYYSDFTLIRTFLGWEPKVPLKEALYKTLNYYRTKVKFYI